MEITIGALRAIGRRRGGQARAAIEIMADHIELMNTRLAEVEAERDRLREVLDAARLTAGGDVGTAHLLSALDDFDAAEARLRPVDSSRPPRDICGAVVRERVAGTMTARTLCPLPPGHDGDHAEALAGDDTDTDRSTR